MKTRDIKRDIKGVFVQPQRKYYIGKIIHGTPYFDPWGFNSTVITIRKLKLRTDNDRNEREKRYPHLKDSPENKYSNLPMARRCKYWIVRDWFIQIGWPVAVRRNELGWKDKFDSPRFEWPPAFYIFFFRWQFCCWWVAPNGDDRYWEMILWYIKYSKKDIKMAEDTWGWVDFNTEKSTWNSTYLVNPVKD